MMSASSVIQPEVLRAALQADSASWLTPVSKQRTGSTNDDVQQLARQIGDLGPRWMLVCADAQQAGRGRLGHAWSSPAGACIALSIATQLTLKPGAWPRASLVVGSAVTEAVRARLGVDLLLKWPNDLLAVVDGQWRKVGGILCERVERADIGAPALWIAGIGLNTSPAASQLPAALRPHVTNLTDLGGRVDHTELVAAIALRVQQQVTSWHKRGGALDIGTIRGQMALLGDPVTLDLGPGQHRHKARLVDLCEDGALLIEPLDGGARRRAQPLQIVGSDGDPPWRPLPRLAH